PSPFLRPFLRPTFCGPEMTMDSTTLPDNAAQCPNCGYILLELQQPRCSECGTRFSPDELFSLTRRATLIPWERPELGGPLTRLARTLAHLWLQPQRAMTHLRLRRGLPIQNAA